ncbi:gamma-glutamyl hydrolase 2 [Quercus suber]|uniref:Gamma-glutamyl hydrolase 2 n=1 Tax=Quercus suber TaxID=58331 RepID=A0AAW0LAU9_QUESU
MTNDAVPQYSSSSSTSSSPSPSSSSSSTGSDMPKNDVVSSSSYSEIWNYLWIPLLISYSKELSLAKAQSTILLPTQDHQLGLADSTTTTTTTACITPDPNLNYRPVIGILSHPGDGASGRLNNATNASYIAASYVKFVESAGARVIPLIYNEPSHILFQIDFSGKIE